MKTCRFTNPSKTSQPTTKYFFELFLSLVPCYLEQPLKISVPFQTHVEIRHTILVSFNSINKSCMSRFWSFSSIATLEHTQSYTFNAMVRRSSKRISLGSVSNPFFFFADIAWWVMVVGSGGQWSGGSRNKFIHMYFEMHNEKLMKFVFFLV